jgi:hypothetical protein
VQAGQRNKHNANDYCGFLWNHKIFGYLHNYLNLSTDKYEYLHSLQGQYVILPYVLRMAGIIWLGPTHRYVKYNLKNFSYLTLQYLPFCR